MLIPAVKGTLRVLRAAKKVELKRGVLTSSIVSMMSNIRRDIFTPDDWSDVNYPNLSTYMKTKTFAEKATWDFGNENARWKSADGARQSFSVGWHVFESGQFKPKGYIWLDANAI